jgi:hypothetical protein
LHLGHGRQHAPVQVGGGRDGRQRPEARAIGLEPGEDGTSLGGGVEFAAEAQGLGRAQFAVHGGGDQF